MSQVGRLMFSLLIVTALGVSAAAGPSGTQEPHEFLRAVGAFTGADLAALASGEAVARVLDTDRREIAVIGAVRVNAPRDRLFERYRDVTGLGRSEAAVEVGIFGPTPREEDLRGLTFEDYDLETIRDCQPGDCGVRLSANDMVRFQRGVNWRAPDWRDHACSLWRRLLAGYAAGYMTGGNLALAEYRNKSQPLRVDEEFKILFSESQYFRAGAPDFFRYMEDYPAAQLAGAENILFWSKENFGMRPVLTITHQTLYTLPAGRVPPAPSAVIATKQIYATHYFDAALGLSLMFDDGDAGFYLLSVNRARTRSLSSFLRGFARGQVQKRSHDALQKLLRSTKLTLERRR